MSFATQKTKLGLKTKKKPPPRPPPPNFSKYKSKSSYNLNQQIDNLIEWSPPNSPTVERTHTFGGSVSSSFSSSTSSLASSKKSFEYEFPITNNLWPVSFNNAKQNVSINSTSSNHVAPYQNPKSSTSTTATSQHSLPKHSESSKINIPAIFGPTIIRPQIPKNKVSNVIERKKNYSEPGPPSPPMPSIPPPSPPKETVDVEVPYGIALYDYQGTDPSDLSFQVNDVIILLRRINPEWLYGKVLDKEGMFPANFIEIQVPLTENNVVRALYEFCPQMEGDLALKPGQLVTVLKKINVDWLYGELNGQTGQFPSNFVEKIPKL